MEKKNKRPLINELTQGKELANQLKNHLDKDTSSLEACEFLVEKIVSSYEKALSMLNWNASLVQYQSPNFPLGLESPPNSFGETSPTSDNSELDSKDQCRKNVFKKRKTMPKWSEQVKVSAGTMAEGPLGDGYSWRKYGQKDILGATFPRAYYRCTHRHVQGCLATKQVQKTDEDPSVVEVTYRGRHSCIQASHLTTALALAAAAADKKVEIPDNKEHRILESHQTQDDMQHFNLVGTCLKAKASSVEKEIFPFPSFSFHSTPIETTENMEGDFFMESISIEDNVVVGGSYSPPFIFGARNAAQSYSDNSGLTADIISAPTSVTNSPMAEFDFQLDFDSLDNILESELFY